MNLETAPKMEKKRIGIVLLDDRGKLIPMIWDLTYSIDCLDAAVAYRESANLINGYQNRTCYINGYSDWLGGVFVENAKHFKVNLIGGLRETIIHEMKMVIFHHLQGMGFKDPGIIMDCVPIKAPYVCSYNSEVVGFDARFEFEDGRNPECDTCQQGLNHLQFQLGMLSGAIVLEGDGKDDVKLTSPEILVGRGAYNQVLFTPVIEGSSSLGKMNSWFVHANAGFIEMARIKSLTFLGI